MNQTDAQMPVVINPFIPWGFGVYKRKCHVMPIGSEQPGQMLEGCTYSAIADRPGNIGCQDANPELSPAACLSVSL